ncbi:hypothetical protein OCU04_009831 [Sclerotinia nivalis]|uniref:DNA/RNA-binding domain-containing protein n=1 Tax=Sclerotinia nivalis TaxID=352851 RepID=A0A9X0AFW9_9HELO|nr:hypothetical protein OCU04_009831 [Sclerotinia nivalis]
MASELPTATNSPSFEGNKASNTISRRSSYRHKIFAPAPHRPIISETILHEWTLQKQREFLDGIYHNIVNHEKECNAMVDEQIAPTLNNSPTQLQHGQLQTLYGLQRGLLFEYNRFIKISQSADALPAIRELVLERSVIERMWKNGIERFLALLSLISPASSVHMLNFTNEVYWILFSLYEEVPDFKNTWAAHLGYIAYFRAIMIPSNPVNTVKETEDRNFWKQIAYNWYLHVCNESPGAGKVYLYLGQLDGSDRLQQMFFFTKSVSTVQPIHPIWSPFPNAFHNFIKASIEEVAEGSGLYSRHKLDTAFIKVHAHILTYATDNLEEYNTRVSEHISQFLRLLDNHLAQTSTKFIIDGYLVAISNINAEFSFYSVEKPLKKAMYGNLWEIDGCSACMIPFRHAENLSNSTLKTVLSRFDDPNILSFVHVTLLFLHNVAHAPSKEAMNLLVPAFPWEDLAFMINKLSGSYQHDMIDRSNNAQFLWSTTSPLIEDYALKGLFWFGNFHPNDFWSRKETEGSKYYGEEGVTLQRTERILWLAHDIAKVVPWLSFDKS